MFTSELSDLLGQSASSSSKKITQGAEFLALWNTCLTARSLSPTYWDITQKKISSVAGRCVLKKTQFRVAPNLCFKASLSANLLIWTSFFILVQIKLIFTRKVCTWPRLESESFWNLEMAYWGDARRQKSYDPYIHVNFEFLNSIGPKAYIGRAKILVYPPWKKLYHSRMT